jgi:predicted double-glycine peptidase
MVGIAIGIALLAGFYTSQDQPKEEFHISIVTPGDDVRLRHRIKPLSEFKDADLVRQMYDYSCGSAALATILNFYLGENLSEKQVINGLLRHGEREKITKRRAFSMLDMKRFVKVLGYRGVGYKAGIDDLRTLDGPCIVSIKPRKYLHFVVFKGIYEDHVFVADPSLGNMSFTVSKFEEIWEKNIALVVYPKGDKGMDALRLEEEDLRIMTEDMARRVLFHYTPLFTLPLEKGVQDDRGEYHFIKKR